MVPFLWLLVIIVMVTTTSSNLSTTQAFSLTTTATTMKQTRSSSTSLLSSSSSSHDNDQKNQEDIEIYDVIVVGAGLAGICLSYYLKEANLSYRVLESRTTSGGMWDELNYPGLRTRYIRILCNGYQFHPLTFD